MSFTPTTFVEGGAPGISAAELNKLGTQYDKALQDVVDAVAPTTQNFGDSPVSGSAVTAARRDHKHGMPAIGVGTPSTQNYGDAASIGVATDAARSDHKHAMPAGDVTALMASDTVRNSNDAQKGQGSINQYVKVKEIRLNANLANVRISMNIACAQGSGGGSYSAYFRIYKNGSPIGTVRATTGNMNWIVFTEDFSSFVANDLIQIYGAVDDCGDQNNVGYVKEMRLEYSRFVTQIMGYSLITPLEISNDPTISVTNQDP